MTAPAPAVPSAVHDHLTLRTLGESVRSGLDPQGRIRLAADLAAVGTDPESVSTVFPAVGRRYGRRPLPGWAGWAVEDGVRTVLLQRLRLEPTALAAVLDDCYWRGDAAERRGVLRALPFLPLGGSALPLVDDALRSNDNRLISAALGPYAQIHLDQHRWRQAVLKCLFSGIPLRRVAGLGERCDKELRRLAEHFAHERRAAGRPVPEDLWLLLSEGSR